RQSILPSIGSMLSLHSSDNEYNETHATNDDDDDSFSVYNHPRRQPRFIIANETTLLSSLPPFRRRSFNIQRRNQSSTLSSSQHNTDSLHSVFHTTLPRNPSPLGRQQTGGYDGDLSSGSLRSIR